VNADDAEDVGYRAELGKLVAGDVLWMMQRIGLAVASPTDEMRIADCPYTRYLRKAAARELARLEGELDE
jgi:hypothetical protein